MKTRGQKGKHGETDRQILELVILNLPRYPDGLTKKQICTTIEKNTGKDREGIKRRITELTKKRVLEGVFVCNNISGKKLYGLSISDLYDLSKLYVIASPELSDFPNEMEQYYIRETRQYFTDFVDYLRLFWPLKGNEWGFPDTVIKWCLNYTEMKLVNDGLFLLGNDKLTQDEEYYRMDKEGHLIEENDRPYVIKSSYTYHPEEYPDYGPERIKRMFRQIEQDSLFRQYERFFSSFLRLVYEFQNETAKIEEENSKWIDPVFTCVVDEVLYDSVYEYINMPDSITSRLGIFFGTLKEVLEVIKVEGSESYINEIPITHFYPHIRLHKKANHAYWEISRFDDIDLLIYADSEHEENAEQEDVLRQVHEESAEHKKNIREWTL